MKWWLSKPTVEPAAKFIVDPVHNNVGAQQPSKSISKPVLGAGRTGSLAAAATSSAVTEGAKPLVTGTAATPTLLFRVTQ